MKQTNVIHISNYRHKTLEKTYRAIVKANLPVFLITEDTVYDINPQAIRDLKFSIHNVEFWASFSGIVEKITIPIDDVIEIAAEVYYE